MNYLSHLWIIFGILFLGLSIFHVSQLNNRIEEFKITERPVRGATVEILGLDTDQPLKDFAKDFNAYISELNDANKSVNLASAIGYFFAALTAFFSAYSSNPQFIKSQKVRTKLPGRKAYIFLP